MTKYGYTTVSGVSNLLSSVEDPQGYVTNYSYRATGPMGSLVKVVTLTSGSGVWGYTYGMTSGGATTQVSVVDPSSGSSVYALNTATGKVATLTDANGYVSRYAYSNQIRVSSSQMVGVSLVYSQSQTYDGNWQVTKSVDGNGNVMSYGYDSSLNLTTITQADGSVSTMGYSGRQMIRSTDPLGNVTSYAYTSAGQLMSMTSARGLLTRYGYDSFGNLATQTASDSGITTNTYDSLNRLTATTDPVGFVTTFTYDLRHETA